MRDVTFDSPESAERGQAFLAAYAKVGLLIYSKVNDRTYRMTAVGIDFLRLDRGTIETRLVAHAQSFANRPHLHRDPMLLSTRNNADKGNTR